MTQADNSGLHATWKGDLLALVIGALLPLAFAPVHFFPLAIVGPAVLFALWLTVTPSRASWRGWLFGVGMFGVGISWIYVAINEFGHSGVLLASVLTGGFVAFLALFPALLGYLATRLFPAQGARFNAIKLLLIFPAAWVLFEWMRGWILTGFPWLNLGYSQIDAPLAGLAPMVGVYGLSWVCALSAGLLVLIVMKRGFARIGAFAAFVGLGLLSALSGSVAWTHPVGAPLRVSLVQGNIPQDLKWRPEARDRTLALYADLTRRHWDSDLILWPEAALPVFYHEVADTYLARLSQEARARGVDMLIGLPVRDQASGRYYNSMLNLDDSGRFYHKRHLVPFGDYLPWAEQLRGLIAFFDLPMSSFSQGPANQSLLEAGGYKIGISICYEDVFGEEVIGALPAAALLVNATNNAWYGDSFAPHQHLQISRMRALETGRFMLRVTTNGISAIIDPKGRIVARSPQFQTYVLTGDAQPRQGATPYVRLGNTPIILLLTGILLGCGVSCGVAWRTRAKQAQA